MEKFDLERALAGEPVCTRNGNEVTRLFLVDVDSKYKLVGVVKKSLLRWTDKGYFLDITNKSENDLFMKPKENAIWVNVYKDNGTGELILGSAFKSEAQAKMVSAQPEHSEYVRTIKIVE
jgi:hypothetical protein